MGKQGVEKSYEKYLRGEKKGVEILLRDAHGRIQGHYKNSIYDKVPIPRKGYNAKFRCGAADVRGEADAW